MYGSPLADATTLLARLDVAELLGTSRQLSAGGDADLADLVAPFVDASASASDDSGDLSPRHLWPLVARVHLRGPFAVTAGGVLLRDVPGLADESASRSGVLERVLEAADSLLLVSSINRAANDKGAKSLLPLPLRRELLDSGYLGDVSKEDRDKLQTFGKVYRNEITAGSVNPNTDLFAWRSKNATRL